MALRYDVPTLERAFRAGSTSSSAARLVGASHSTAANYFKRFADAGIPRAKRQRKYKRARYDDGWPAPYTGPEWIGKAIV